jgi:hypothetical protein
MLYSLISCVFDLPFLTYTLECSCLDQVRKRKTTLMIRTKTYVISPSIETSAFPRYLWWSVWKLLYLLAKCGLRFFQKVKLYWKHTTIVDSVDRNWVDKNCRLKFQEVLARPKRRKPRANDLDIHKIKYRVKKNTPWFQVITTLNQGVFLCSPCIWSCSYLRCCT